MNKSSNKFSPEVRERAVRMVQLTNNFYTCIIIDAKAIKTLNEKKCKWKT